MTESRDQSSARLELLVEPFRENQPGPHVIEAISAVDATGMVTDMGPFASTASGTLEQAIAAATALVRAAFDNGADAVQLRIERLD